MKMVEGGNDVQIEGYSGAELIGSGGLGNVYRARRDSTGVIVAIKVLKDVDDESMAWRRTQRELEALAALAGHAHVIGVMEVSEVPPSGRALVMEYAEDGSVADLLNRRKSLLTVAETVLIGRHTASALEAAHERGIVHRDVKPQNLLIDRYGQVKLCDFGVAALLRSEEFRDRTSALSMRYASPEDLEEEDEVGPPSDIYSLGATLLHLSRGAPPTLAERLSRWEPPVSNGDADRDGLDSIIGWCLDPDPMKRPTAGALHSALDDLDRQMHGRERALVVEQLDDEQMIIGQPSVFDEPTLHRHAQVGTQKDGDGNSAMPMRPINDSSNSSGSWTVLAAVALTILLITGVIFVWTGSKSDQEPVMTTVTATTSAASIPSTSAPQSPATVAVTPRPVDAGQLGGAIFPDGPVGECVLAGDDGVFVVVDCGSIHDAQRFGRGNLDSIPAETPFEEDAIAELVSDRCTTHGMEFFDGGAALLPAGLELRTLLSYPSAVTWQEGDRSYQCWLASPTTRIVGDARDDRR